MKKVKQAVVAILAAAAFAPGFLGQEAQGSMITGDITLTGGATFDTSSLATVTRVDAFQDVTVTSLDGDFSSFAAVGDSVAMAEPWIFSSSTPTPDLWSAGGFTFDLAAATVVTQTANFLRIAGSGTLTGNGFTDTPGTWIFSSEGIPANGVFRFISATAEGNGVPDGGTTVALLGLGFGAVEVLRRKLATA